MDNNLSIPVIVAVLLGTVIIVVIALTMLWNWLMPTLFGLPTISPLQAAGLILLSQILFARGSGKGK